MDEAIDYIMQAWTATEPFDFHGQFFHGEDIVVAPPSVQKPHVPVGVASSYSTASMERAGRRGFMPLFGQFDSATRIRECSDVYVAAGLAAGREASRGAIHVTRFTYVSDSVEQAKNELRETMTATLEHEKQVARFKFDQQLPPSGRLEDLTVDYLIDAGHHIAGDPDTVYQGIKDFYDQCGGFGVYMLTMGWDYATREQRARSLKLFMDEVAPRLRALRPDRKD
jgi:alkanesulfonate monooxygenase SsuD/methylene tetrahydromethanopterin reductase-like flavin-dependent oxidoreductase (luciferase family)